MNNIQKKSTLGIAIFILTFAVFISFFTEYDNLNRVKQELAKTQQSNRTTLQTTIYNSLAIEAKQKVDKVKSEMESDMIDHYDSEEKFIQEYDELLTGVPYLIDIVDQNINNKENRYFKVESDSNDMFVFSENGVIADKSEDCSVEFGATRSFENEISMHARPDLAQQAIYNLLAGSEKGVFWSFLPETKKNQVATMNIEKVLELPLEDLKSYEFLVPAYIHKSEDFIKNPSVLSTGHKGDSRRLIIIQGFNLYEQIQEYHKTEYNQMVSSYENNIKIIESNQRALVVKMILLIIVAILTPVVIALSQKIEEEGNEQ